MPVDGDRPNELPVPYNGHAQYSHQLLSAHTRQGGIIVICIQYHKIGPIIQLSYNDNAHYVTGEPMTSAASGQFGGGPPKPGFGPPPTSNIGPGSSPPPCPSGPPGQFPPASRPIMPPGPSQGAPRPPGMMGPPLTSQKPDITTPHSSVPQQPGIPPQPPKSAHQRGLPPPPRDRVASRIMFKMGYTPGEGLGKKQHGIVEPIKPVFKNDRKGLGCDDQERKEKKVSRGGVQVQPKKMKISEIPNDSERNKENFSYKIKSVLPDNQTQKRQRQEKVFNKIEELAKASKGPVPYDADTLFKALNSLKKQYAEEYWKPDVQRRVKDVASSSLLPKFVGWDPMNNSRFLIATMEPWRTVLEAPQSFGATTVYEDVMLEIWNNHIKKLFTDWSQISANDKRMELLQTWEPMLTVFLCDEIFENNIISKVRMTVLKWNPSKNYGRPIATFLIRWKSLLGKYYPELYDTIVKKLETVLHGWDFSCNNGQCFAMFTHWEEFLPRSSIDTLLITTIIPKFTRHMSEFKFTSEYQKQELDKWDKMMIWANVLGLDVITPIVCQQFFSGWKKYLQSWLDSHPDYYAVYKWYISWKRKFPELLLDSGKIRNEFTEALNMMNHALLLESGSLVSTVSKVSSPTTPLGDSQGVTMKDYMGKEALKQGIDFVDTGRCTEDGNKIYKFGQSDIYIVRHVVYAKTDTGSYEGIAPFKLIAREK